MELAFGSAADVTGAHFLEFQDSNDTELTGSVVAASGTAVTHIVSDYRLKENISSMTGGLDKVNALKPSYFNYKSYPDTIHQGFIAHEVQEAGIGYAVAGEKDAMKIQTREDRPHYGEEVKDVQKFVITNIIPQMVSAIQELSAEVEKLKNG